MAGETNSLIQKMLGTAVPNASTADPSATPDASMPTLQAIATNGKLLIENVSKLAQIVEGWQ
jgi:hypothetical protein